jgi:hypothetical protein
MAALVAMSPCAGSRGGSGDGGKISFPAIHRPLA